MNERIPAEGFLPGDFIREELEARGWAQEDLAEILGRTPTAINEVVTGKRGITVDTAKGLGEALGGGAQFWLNMESAYRLSLESSKPDSVARKAFLYGIAPVRAMIKRNWIESSTNIDVLEQRLKEFFQTPDLSNIPTLNCKARKSTEELTPSQKAWLFRAKNLAMAVHAEKFDKTRLSTALKQLQNMKADETSIRLIPKVLADAGIKLIIIEPFPQSKIDGVSFWLNGAPIIALSLRYDRVDSFWHTLMHEIGHIKNEDGLKENCIIVDVDLFEERDIDTPYEKAADEFAADFLVPRQELDNFISRFQSIYSKSKIINFAKRIGVHPGIVVGQLHYRGKENGGIDYSHNREMLVKIRHIITNVALTDGYGQIISVNLN
jgi:HTH-type transcriptional regulator/antitoxin HigA